MLFAAEHSPQVLLTNRQVRKELQWVSGVRSAEISATKSELKAYRVRRRLIGC